MDPITGVGVGVSKNRCCQALAFFVWRYAVTTLTMPLYFIFVSNAQESFSYGEGQILTQEGHSKSLQVYDRVQTLLSQIDDYEDKESSISLYCSPLVYVKLTARPLEEIYKREGLLMSTSHKLDVSLTDFMASFSHPQFPHFVIAFVSCTSLKNYFDKCILPLHPEKGPLTTLVNPCSIVLLQKVSPSMSPVILHSECISFLKV